MLAADFLPEQGNNWLPLHIEYENVYAQTWGTIANAIAKIQFLRSDFNYNPALTFNKKPLLCILMGLCIKWLCEHKRQCLHCQGSSRRQSLRYKRVSPQLSEQMYTKSEMQAERKPNIYAHNLFANSN